MSDCRAIQRSYRLRAYPNATQRKQLAICMGHSRFAYNLSLESISFAYRTQGQNFTTIDASRALTELKRDPDYAWLRDCPATCISQSLRSLDAAFKNFFAGRAQYPKFKKKSGKQVAKFQLDSRNLTCSPGKWLKLPKLGLIKLRWCRVPKGLPKMATVTLDADGRYWCSFMVEETIQPIPKTGEAIGVDMGIKDIAVTSNGWHSGAPRHTYRLARELKLAQRKLARKQKGSRRRAKQRVKVARIHARIAASRQDALHKISHAIIKQADVICIEDLNVKGMARNHCLAKAVSDASMGELRRQIEYKAAWNDRTVVKIDRWFPSTKMCSSCGKLHDMPLNKRTMACDCGNTMDRDANAAQNILAEGVRSLRDGGRYLPDDGLNSIDLATVEARDSRVMTKCGTSQAAAA